MTIHTERDCNKMRNINFLFGDQVCDHVSLYFNFQVCTSFDDDCDTSIHIYGLLVMQPTKITNKYAYLKSFRTLQNFGPYILKMWKKTTFSNQAMPQCI